MSSGKWNTSLTLHTDSQWVKNVRIRIFPCPYFYAFELNTERYSVSLCIQSKCGKIRTRKTPKTATFHAVSGTSFLGSFTWSELVSLSNWASITWLLSWYSLGESNVSQNAAFPSTWNYHYNNVKGESMKCNEPNLEIIPFMIWQLQKELI